MRQIAGNIDACVVGGGLAGLTAAALLADAGLRVTLFERSDAVGGRAVTQVTDGFHLNLGPHAWYRGGPGTAVLSKLGIQLRGRIPKPAGAFALRRGTLHTLPIGFISLLTTDLFGLHGKLEASRLLARLPKLDTSPFDRQTFASWLEGHIRDADVRSVFDMFVRVAMYANAPAIMSAGVSLAAFQLVLQHNVQYLDHGWQLIVDALEARARALGVQIIRSAPVGEVVPADAGAWHAGGVRLADGQVIASPHVVLAVPPDVAARLVPTAPASATRGWRGIPSRAACLDVGLARLPKPAHTLAFGVDRPLYYSVHSATADLAPANGAMIHVAKYLDATTASDARADQQELEAFLDMLQPGWRVEVVVQRYLPSMTVTHAIPLAAHGGLKGRPSVDPGQLPGLYLAGDWVGGAGTLANAAVASGERAARLIVERSRQRPSPKPLEAGAVA